MINGDLIKSNKYSTEEIDTGQIWIDGKPLYRKVIITTMNNISNLINNLGFDTITFFYGQVTSKYNNTWNIPNHFEDESNYDVFFNIDNNNHSVSITGKEYYTNESKCVCTIEYTKTTD